MFPDNRAGTLVSVAIFLSVFLFVAANAADAQVRYNSGLSVQPAFDGYEVNEDGTYTLWFAYLNRNYEEIVEVPIGPDNMFEPGPIDRGQPTRFLPRRHKSMFGVVVPPDFGTLTWHLTVRGEKASAIATPNIHNIIDRKRNTLGSGGGQPPNLAPTVEVEPATLSLAVGQEGTLDIRATDDGLPAFGGRVLGMTYALSVYRGEGMPAFMPAAGKIEDGRATAKVSFDAPGEYMVHVRVDDGSGRSGVFCCWADAVVKVTVD